LLNLDQQAQAIVDHLKTYSCWSQVTFLERDEKEATITPVKMPCLHVILEDAVFDPQGNRSSNLNKNWLIIVRAKAQPGRTGLLALVDNVLDALEGFRELDGFKPLEPLKVEYLKQYGEATAYAITFGSSQRVAINKQCEV